MSLKPFLRTVATYIPGLYTLLTRGTGGSTSAKYCYSVWLRHLLMLERNGLSTQPYAVAELGPGDSLGIGLAALLSGAEQYYALDVNHYASVDRNLRVFDELVSMFQARLPIPHGDDLAAVKPVLESYAFPDHILSTARLQKVLDAGRLTDIRQSLTNPTSAQASSIVRIKYFVPWHQASIIEENSVDLIISQAVLEHVDNLDFAYKAMSRWLKSGGCMSHQIDFKCHETASVWNGHWGYSDFMWHLIQNKRPDRINRQPHSVHLEWIKSNGFEILSDIPFTEKSGLTRRQLAPRFKLISDEDLMTSSAFIQAVSR